MLRMTQHPADTQHNLPVLTVGEVSQEIKRTMEDRFRHLRVRGEISGFKRAASGHLYFKLKDADAVLDAVCWRGQAGRLAIRPEDGMEVIATGRVTTYPGRSSYQIVVDSLDLAGEGALLKMLEDRRRRLAAEGLFDAERKRPLPHLPRVIGVVTSPTGAVIRDILHRLHDRFPTRVLVWPVLVQGTGAAEQVAAAIRGFNALPPDGPVPRPDLIIVARGGGSLEDLMAFNEEAVVRAAADSALPLISAVGHETDTTLIDHAADLRAPTPTAAAELAVPVRRELLAQVLDDGARLEAAMARLMDGHRLRLTGLARGLPDPRRLAETAAQRLDDWSERLANALAAGLDRRRQRLASLSPPSPRHRLDRARERLAGESRALGMAAGHLLVRRRDRLERLSGLLDSYSYERVLERGFALVSDAVGQPVTRAKGLKAGQDLSIRFGDGSRAVRVTGGAAPKPAPPARKPRRDPDDQGDLF
ncbi:MAG: exodeoxyribonuclease VII large subunit [Rhodobacterales bacterium]|nr:exodeoxyribonuclease VII large subunit [Rhodobacterales bacterium]